MRVWVEVKPYQRKFLVPLKTAHGPWHCREGLLLCLKAETGKVSFGEVAPMPWFGTETLEAARDFWQERSNWVEEEALSEVPHDLPASQFGAGSALEGLNQEWHDHPQGLSSPLGNGAFCGLLPAGENALETAKRLFGQGLRTFKWKVGVYPTSLELAWLDTLVARLPEGCHLRLDANGGLALPEAEAWLAHCDALNDSSLRISDKDGRNRIIEYLEQPLPPGKFADLKLLSQRFSTPIALDESVTTVGQMEECDRNRWPGLYVVKPSIAGFPRRLRPWLHKVGSRVAFSSAFETVVGRQAALKIATDHNQKYFSPGNSPALGFGTLGYFADDWDNLTPEQLWDRI